MSQSHEAIWAERFRRRNLPHWEVQGGSYFITFRLAGSLPHAVAEDWLRERQSLKAKWKALDAEEHRRKRRLLNRKFDAQLDEGGTGPTHLNVPAVAAVVRDALLFFSGRRYTLAAFTVMPNHVHAVLQPAGSEGWVAPLDRVMHSIKSYTAHAANRILGRSGPFWQREYYDHLLREADDVMEFIRYTLENPVQARLCERPEDWPWSNAREFLTEVEACS